VAAARPRGQLHLVPRRRLPTDLDGPETPEPTARPTGELARELEDEDGDKLVPKSNVGGAAPTPLGLDSGGDLLGPEDDLANLSEPEPPEPPEVRAVQVRDDEGPRGDRSGGRGEE
jgi:hypothetical protein